MEKNYINNFWGAIKSRKYEKHTKTSIYILSCLLYHLFCLTLPTMPASALTNNISLNLSNQLGAYKLAMLWQWSIIVNIVNIIYYQFSAQSELGRLKKLCLKISIIYEQYISYKHHFHVSKYVKQMHVLMFNRQLKVITDNSAFMLSPLA